MLAYQVCECTTSAPAQPPTISRSTPRVRRAALAVGEPGGSAYAVVPASARVAAEAVHPRVDPVRGTRSARTSSATWTPAPP